jgi:uncharacterized protein (DUF885 family)
MVDPQLRRRGQHRQALSTGEDPAMNTRPSQRLSPLVALALLAPGIIAPRQPVPSTAADPETRFMALAGEFVHQSLAIAPSNASAAGYHEHREPDGRVVQLDAVLDDFSLSAYESQARFYRDWRARLAAMPKQSLGPQAAADWQLVDDQMALQLLEYDQIQNTRHNPTVVVETIGTALFLPLTQKYAPEEVRIGHVLSRLEQVPRALMQARDLLLDADPIFIKVALQENEGNIELIENTIQKAVAGRSSLEARYQSAAAQARAAIHQFDDWLRTDLAQRKTDRTWRLGTAWYAAKFKYALGALSTPEQVLADADAELSRTRAEMLQLATPLHAQWFPDHGTHPDRLATDRENAVLGEVLQKISADHPNRAHLLESVSKDLEQIRTFIRDKGIVSLGTRNNLQVIPTPPFMRGTYSVAGFHAAPPLEPTAEAQYWVTPMDPGMPEAAADSKLREYNDWVLLWLTIHEALPGHYVQAEHANDLQPPVRRLVRTLFGNGPYVEGWAEYIADVMMDAGFADKDPRFQISRKKVWLRAVANAILDVRLHTKGLSDQEALDLMQKRCFQTQAEAEGKLQRAKLSSAQLPTYFLGAREWWRLRKQFERRAGASFDMKAFHDQALDAGPLAVPALEPLLKQ